jgi:LmbE family N-acetylglucosaminyl deacetylase
MRINVADYFAGSGLIVVPHMDDEVLACGGTIALLPDKSAWHVAYATDGMGSPEPVVPWRDKITPDLGRCRRLEAEGAMALLGLPPANLHFLDLPDGHLRRHAVRLRRALLDLIVRLEPDHVLVPFRYDRHPDHLALNHGLVSLTQEGLFQGSLTEYFVYYRWRLLPAGDVRRYLLPGLLQEVDVTLVAGRKRAALDCFTSQTTRYFPWQTRPNLTPELLDEVSRAPEQYLRFHPALPGPAVFIHGAPWIRLAHQLEPFLKRRKDRLVAWWQRAAALFKNSPMSAAHHDE